MKAVDDKLKNIVRSLPSCEDCRNMAEKFGEGFRDRAISCAGETAHQLPCDDCLVIIIEAVRRHGSTKK